MVTCKEPRTNGLSSASYDGWVRPPKNAREMTCVGRYGAVRSSRSVIDLIVGLIVLTTFLTLGQSVAAGAGAARTTLHARVVRVSPGLAPYNPRLASAGTPVEKVTFAVHPEPAGNYFACVVAVRHRGKLVGHTQVSFSGPWDYPPSADLFGVQVEVGRRTFKAAPSDATVKCHT
jgi:hypothetical protein